MKKRLFNLFVVLTVSVTAATAQQQKLYQHKVGDYLVTLLSDGPNTGKADLLIGATPEMIQETMPDSTYSTAVNYFLVQTPEKNYLIDTGLGKSITENLYRINLTPDNINTIILTHLHGDHIGGLLKDGNKLFPHASIQISEVEKAYWTSDIAMHTAGDRMKSFVPVRQTLAIYEDQTEQFIPRKLELIEEDGIFFIEAYGHTPGHTAVLLQSQGERLLIWGDVMHAMAIQMPYPEVALKYDVDPEMAIETRREIMEFVAGNRIPVAGMHLPYPALGIIEDNSRGGYEIKPTP